MNFKVLFVSALMFLGLTAGSMAQEITMSTPTGLAGDIIYTGTFTMRGDSSTFSLEGKIADIKDFATATIGLFNTASVYSDTCVLATYGEWPAQVRLKSVDSVGTKYGNYLDITAINDKSEPIYFWAYRTALTATTWTVKVVIHRGKIDYIPEKLLNAK